MNLWILKSGHKVRMRSGVLAKVLSETEDGVWVRVQYLESGDASVPVGAEETVNESEVEALLGVAHPSAWLEEVGVVLHHVPESEDSEAYFEAVTMKGVPYGVSISGSAPDLAEGALKQLLDGLQAFGFTGRVIVDDVTGLGRPDRYELRTGSV
jgi:hypothetical protein